MIMSVNTATFNPGYIMVTATSSATNTITIANNWNGTIAGGSGTGSYENYPIPIVVKEVEAPVLLLKGQAYKMPNGSVCHIDGDGGFRICDKDAKIIYRANRVYDFNPFLNASDMLEEYIKELAPHGVRQDQVLKIPIISFINWLVHKAMEKDGEPPPQDVPRLPSIPNNGSRTINRCGLCGRFIRNAFTYQRIYFCSPDHMSEKLRRLDLCQRQLTIKLD
jgi:hypothetical protein